MHLRSKYILFLLSCELLCYCLPSMEMVLCFKELRRSFLLNMNIYMHAYLFQTLANRLNSRWQPSPITKHASELQMVEIKAKLIHTVLNQAE